MRALVLVTVLASIGCKGKVRVLADTKQVSNNVVVTLNVEPATAGTIHFSGSKGFEKLGDIAVPSGGRVEIEVPVAQLAGKKQTVDVTFSGAGHGLTSSTSGTGTFTVEPRAAEVRLKFAAVAQEGALDVTCQGELCDSKWLPITADALLSVKLTECDGCTIEIGGRKLEVEDGKKTTIDLTNAVGDANVADFASLAYLKIPVKITPAEGEAPEPPVLELLGSVPVAIVLGRVAKGPVAFAKDKPAASPRAAVVVRADAKYGTVTQVGSAKRIREFDLVGVAIATEKSLGSCGVYKKESTGEKVNVALKGVNFDVTMYDRLTGKSLGKKSFAAVNKGCHDTLVSDVIVALPDNEQVASWAKTFLKD